MDVMKNYAEIHGAGLLPRDFVARLFDQIARVYPLPWRRGTVKWKVDPLLGSLSTQILPPWASTTRQAMASPRPVLFSPAVPLSATA